MNKFSQQEAYEAKMRPLVEKVSAETRLKTRTLPTPSARTSLARNPSTRILHRSLP